MDLYFALTDALVAGFVYILVAKNESDHILGGVWLNFFASSKALFFHAF